MMCGGPSRPLDFSCAGGVRPRCGFMVSQTAIVRRLTTVHRQSGLGFLGRLAFAVKVAMLQIEGNTPSEE